MITQFDDKSCANRKIGESAMENPEAKLLLLASIEQVADDTNRICRVYVESGDQQAYT